MKAITTVFEFWSYNDGGKPREQCQCYKVNVSSKNYEGKIELLNEKIVISCSFVGILNQSLQRQLPDLKLGQL